MTADFQNRLISRLFSVFFEWFFSQNNSKRFVEWILTQIEDFAKLIALAWWPIFKVVSFLEYLVFFRAVFCSKTTVNDLYYGVLHVFLNLNF